jgi:hypothetical protein
VPGLNRQTQRGKVKRLLARIAISVAHTLILERVPEAVIHNRGRFSK